MKQFKQDLMAVGFTQEQAEEIYNEETFTYYVALTGGEIDALIWCEARGYSGDLVSIATVRDNEEGKGHVVLLEEWQAWEWLDNIEEDEHAFGACMSHELLNKLNEMRYSVV